MFDADDGKSIKRTVAGGILMIIVGLLWTSLSGFVASADDGTEALKKFDGLSVRMDTIEVRQKCTETFIITAGKDISQLQKDVSEGKERDIETQEVVFKIYETLSGQQWKTNSSSKTGH